MSAPAKQTKQAPTDQAPAKRGSAKQGAAKQPPGRGEEALRRFHEEEDLDRVYDLSMLLRLWKFVRPHGAYVWGSMGLLVLMAVFGLVRPLVMRAALDHFQEPGGSAYLTEYGILVAALIVLEQGLAFPQMYWIQIAGARAMAELRAHIFGFIHGRNLGFFDRTPIGRLVTRVTNDTDAIAEMFSSGALNAAGDLIRLVAIVAIMLWIDWKMSLFAFAVLPPLAAGVDWTRRRMRRAYREVRVKTARMNAFLNEQVNGIAVVQAYAREAQSQEEFDAINASYRDANMRGIVLDSTLDAAIEMVGSVCIATVLWYAGAREISPNLGFGTLFAFVAYIEMFFQPVRNLSARYTQIQSALAAAERVFQLLAMGEKDAEVKRGTESAVARARESWPDDNEKVAFRLAGVTFAYKPGVPVLHGLKFEARRGETIAVVGPTGSGKSTVASLLLRLYEPQEGEVEVFGRDVRELERDALRRQFSVVPQDVFLFPGTVASNVAAADPEPDRERVRGVLTAIGALDLFEARKGGIDAPVIERGSNFSAGERQLIAFARALYKNPPLLVLDEPTANIDSDTESRLQHALEAVTEGRTALIIAHRLSTIRHADRIVVMHLGTIVEQGSHEELLALGGVYARLHRLQVARQAIEERIGELA